MNDTIKVFFLTSAALDGIADVGYYIIRDLLTTGGVFERVTTVREADVIAFSCGTAMAFPCKTTYGTKGKILLEAIKAFKRDPKKLVLVGGNISKSPASIERFADIVCIGHAFSFAPAFVEIARRWRLENLSKQWLLEETAKVIPNAFVPAVHRRLYDPLNLKYSYLEGGKTISYDPVVDWPKCKAYELGEGNYSVLATVGCKRKCMFCEPGWVESWDEERDANKVIFYNRNATPNQRIPRISWVSDNLAAWKLGHLIKTRSFSATVDDLLKDKHVAKRVRTGIEGYSQRLRKIINKPLADKELERLFMGVAVNRELKLFYIEGFPYATSADIEEFADFWGRDWGSRKLGRLIFKFTFFIPTNNTPMAWSPYYNASPMGGRQDEIYTRIRAGGNRRVHLFLHISTPTSGFLRTLRIGGTGYLGSHAFAGEEYWKFKGASPKADIDTWLQSIGIYDLDRGYDVFNDDEHLPNEFVRSRFPLETLKGIGKRLEQHVVTRGPEQYPDRRSDVSQYKALEDIPGLVVPF